MCMLLLFRMFAKHCLYKCRPHMLALPNRTFSSPVNVHAAIDWNTNITGYSALVKEQDHDNLSKQTSVYDRRLEKYYNIVASSTRCYDTGVKEPDALPGDIILTTPLIIKRKDRGRCIIQKYSILSSS
jgi:hypothetical protein